MEISRSRSLNQSPSFGIKLLYPNKLQDKIDNGMLSGDLKLLKRISDAFEAHPSKAEIYVDSIDKSMFTNKNIDHGEHIGCLSSCGFSGDSAYIRNLFDYESKPLLNHDKLQFVKSILRRILNPEGSTSFNYLVGAKHKSVYNSWWQQYIAPIWKDIDKNFKMDSNITPARDRFYNGIIKKQKSNIAYKSQYQLQKDAEKYSRDFGINDEYYKDLAVSYNEYISGLANIKRTPIQMRKGFLEVLKQKNLDANSAMKYLIKIADVGEQWRRKPSSYQSMETTMKFFSLDDPIERDLVKDYVEKLYFKRGTYIVGDTKNVKSGHTTGGVFSTELKQRIYKTFGLEKSIPVFIQIEKEINKFKGEIKPYKRAIKNMIPIKIDTPDVKGSISTSVKLLSDDHVKFNELVLDNGVRI